MVEQAFKVVKGSSLYNKYFEAIAERQKLHDLAVVFFKKHNLLNDGLGYRMIKPLAMQLTAEQKEKYKTQLKKAEDANGMCYFKKASPMCREWQQDVSDKVDFSIIDRINGWFWPYITRGQYALWHLKDELYGCLSDEHKDKLDLADYMIPIKMSTYYAIMELNEDE